MDKLTILYTIAIDQTKAKIQEDINRYFEMNENMPSYGEYIEERSHYVKQIWMNVWLNKVTNDVGRKEKKAYLKEKGYEIEGMDRKLVNRLFRNEMRDFQPFDGLEYLLEIQNKQEMDWEERYKKARLLFLKREEEKHIQAKKDESKNKLEEAAHRIVAENQSDYYLFVRYYAAKTLAADFQKRVKFEEPDSYQFDEILIEAGPFQPEEYSTVSAFFGELTGNVQNTFHYGEHYFEYETYYFAYEKRIADYLFGNIPKLVLEQLPSDLINNFEETLEEELTPSIIRKMLANAFYLLVNNYMEALEEEYVSDLLHLADIPFEERTHRKLLERDISDRERKKAEELAEMQRKKEEEARMLDDIFGNAYIPTAGRNIRYVLHIGETNTGKTYQALKRMQEADSGLYLAPLRLLALEVFDTLNAEGLPCSLKTGEEEKISLNAKHIACTVEMFHEKEFYEVVVIDEAQMIADKDRGFSWYKAITKANAKEVHIIGSFNIKNMILQLLGEAEIEVNEYSRDIPLEVESKLFTFSDAKKGDALVCFSRKRVLETASILQRNGFLVSMIYGSMPPETRKKQMQRFIDGETSVIVATDAIGMGLNLPIRRIVFLQNDKFDGTKRRRLTSQEVKQIAGRAGRKGIYNIGKVAFTSDINAMSKLLQQKDTPVHTFAIAPTSSILERFQRYSRKLGTFFELWEKFESPQGTEKATLIEEQYLYEMVEDTMIEARLSVMDLYGFLHLPFSTKEELLANQWYKTMEAIVEGKDLPDPYIKKESLEEVELSYKAVGLHLLFLYRLDKRTEAVYWERIRETLSDEVHERLKTDVKSINKQCKKCGKDLDADFEFSVCDSCHYSNRRKKHRSFIVKRPF